MTHSSNEQIKDAAAFACEAIDEVCSCGGMQAVAVVIAAKAKEIAAEMTAAGYQTAPEQIAKAMSSRAIRIIRDLPYPEVH